MPTDLGCRKGGIEHGNRSRRGKRPQGDQVKVHRELYKTPGHVLWSGCRGWYSLLSADKKGNRDGRGCPNDGGSHAPVLLHSNV